MEDTNRTVETSRCRSCGKKVIFATDQNGKTQILDAVAPVYSMLDPGDTVCARFRNAYVSHFATCPNATAHSSKTKTKA